MSTYAEILDFLFAQLPMFHREGKAAYKENLDTTIELCKRVGDPQLRFPSVHIAGTNGKGSTSCMVASMCQEAGLKTGLFTSPHFIDYRERIRVNGEMIPEENVIEFVNEHKHLVSDLSPSFFEWTAAMAFDHFAKEEVDIAIIETGLGGRLDSTNVVKPLCTCITSIGMDHADLLGGTICSIAHEKAGIMKEGVPMVIPEGLSGMPRTVIECHTIADGVPLVIAPPIAQQSLLGEHMDRNAGCALAIFKILRERFSGIEEEHFEKGLERIAINTGLRGRWERIGTEPLTIADVAHNAPGFEAMLKNLEQTPHEKLHIVFGVLEGKDVKGVMSLLPKDAVYYFARPDVPRGMDVRTLETQARKQGLRGDSHADIPAAMKAARKAATGKDLVLVTGSFFTVAECI